MLVSQKKGYDFSWGIGRNRRVYIKRDAICMQICPFKRGKKEQVRDINYKAVCQPNCFLMEYFSDSMKHSAHLKRNKKVQAGSKSLLLSFGTDHWILARLQSATNCGLPFAHSVRMLLIHCICFHQPVPVSVLSFIGNSLCSEVEYTREVPQSFASAVIK